MCLGRTLGYISIYFPWESRPNKVTLVFFQDPWSKDSDDRQFIGTSAEVTRKGALVRESYPKWSYLRLRIYNKLPRIPACLHIANLRNLSERSPDLFGPLLCIHDPLVHPGKLSAGSPENDPNPMGFSGTPKNGTLLW